MKNTFVKVLSFVMALMMVVGTFSTLAVFADDHVHTKGTLVETKAPTCQKNGYSTYICGVEGCGAEWTTDLVLASAKYHNYEEKAAEDATCSSNAKPAATVCSHCGLTPDGQPRPETAGTKLDHVFVGKITEATCDVNKKLVYTCSLCGKTAEQLKEAGETIDAKWNAVEYEGTAQNKDHKEADKLSWTVVTAPSQTATECLPGLAQCTCTKCGEIVDTAEIPADHTWVDLNEKNLDCIEWNKGVLACKVCGEMHPDNKDAKKRETYGHNVVLVIGTTADAIADLTEDDYNYPVDAKNPPQKFGEDGTTKVAMTIAELAELGFANGDKLHKAAKCNEKGSALVQCSCGEVYVKEIDTASHDWGNGWQTNTLDAKTVKCTDAVTKTRKCSDCQLEETKVLKPAAATAHNLVVDEDASQVADCDSIGYTVKVCQNKTILGVPCNHTVEEDHKDALGHTWGAATFKSGDSCTAANAKYEHKCSVCEKVEETAKPDSVTGCTWGAEVTVAATCMLGEYKYTPCTICKAWKDNADKEPKPADDAEPNENNHVYPSEDDMKKFVNGTYDGEYIVGYAAGTTSTCTSAGKLTVKCTNPACATKNTIITVDAPLKNHDIRTNLAKIEYKDGKLVTTHTTQIDATCTAAGAKADGEACYDCTYVKKQPTVIALDPDAHPYDKDDLVFEVEATCLTPGYKQYNASCTHGIITVILNDGALAGHKYTTETGADNWFEFDKAECLEDGNHAYIGCIWCEEIKPGTASMKTSIEDCGCGMTGDDAAEKHKDLAEAGNYVIPATGHDYEEVKVKRETCDKAGVAAHLACKNCDYKKLGDTEYDYSKDDGKKAFDLAAAIPAHYGQYTTKFDKKDATCTDRGISPDAAAESWCTVCDVGNKYGDGVGDWLDIPALNHEKDGESLKKDMYINLVKIDSLTAPADKSSGDALNQWLASLNFAGEEVELEIGFGTEGQTITAKNFYVLKDCTKDGAIVTVCSGCGASETVFVYATNTEHKYADKWVDDVVPTGTQTCYVTATEKKICTVLGCEAKLTQTKENGAATGHYTTKGVVNGEKFFFEYDCTKIDEYKEYSCDKCGTKYTDLLTVGVNGLTGDAQKATIQAVKHDVIDLKQDPTCTEDGYVIKECKNCVWIDSEKTPYGLADTENKILPNLGGHNKDHEKTIVLEDVAPTLEQDGRFVYVCGVCGETITEIIAASLAVDSVIAPEYAVYSSGNIVNAIVTITADEFSFNTLTIDVNSALKLVDFEMLAKFDVNTSAFINADGDVVIFAEDTLTGDFQNATFAGGEDVALIKLTFATGKFATGEYTFATEINAAEIYNADEDKLEAVNLIDAAEDEKAKITVTVPGNFNGDTTDKGEPVIDARDLASFLPALANAVLTGEVENKYDLNNDGKVDFTDVAGLRAYIADGQSLKSYLAMTGEDLDAALAANGAPVFVNAQGVIVDNLDEATRKMLFANAMEAVIATFSVKDYTDLCTRKDVNVDNLTDLIGFIAKLATQEAINEDDVNLRSIVFTANAVIIRTDAEPITISY